MERRRLGGISPVGSCAPFPPRYVPHCSKGIRFPVKCFSSTVGVQKFGMLLNAAKPLALGWWLFWVSSQVGMTESPRQFCGRVGHFARVWFKMTALGFRASFCKNCAGRMKILLVPAWVESFLLVLERGDEL